MAALLGPAPVLTAVVLADGSERPCGGSLVPVTLRQRSGLAEQLGVALEEPRPLAVDAVAVDAKNRTSVPGLFAAGGAGGAMPSVANAVASGSTAAAMVVGSLTVAPCALAPAAAASNAPHGMTSDAGAA